MSTAGFEPARQTDLSFAVTRDSTSSCCVFTFRHVLKIVADFYAVC